MRLSDTEGLPAYPYALQMTPGEFSVENFDELKKFIRENVTIDFCLSFASMKIYFKSKDDAFKFKMLYSSKDSNGRL